MNTVRKLRVWTQEQRAEQSRKLRERKIWLASTGPKTTAGKLKSSNNSYKHGLCSQHHRAFIALMKKYKQWSDIWFFIANNPKKILTNELVDFMYVSGIRKTEKRTYFSGRYDLQTSYSRQTRDNFTIITKNY